MNKLLGLTAAGTLLSASALQGQIELTDNLSVTGFIDMSGSYTEIEGPGLNTSGSSFNLDQVEIDFLLSYDEITGQIDINYLGDNESGDVDLEQAFLTYDFGNNSSITAGRFLSYHGWETAEPTGLYQFSFAYDLHEIIPGYHNGISFDEAGDWGSFGVALVDSVYDADGSLGTGGPTTAEDPNGAGDAYEFGIEAKLVLTPMEGLTLYFGYALDSADDGFEDRKLYNFWASYETGIHTVALELNDFEEGETEVDQWLAMWSAALTDKGVLTARISNDVGNANGPDEADKYTLAWIQAVTDNLAVVTEFSHTDFNGGITNDSFAVEALFTF